MLAHPISILQQHCTLFGASVERRFRLVLYQNECIIMNGGFTEDLAEKSNKTTYFVHHYSSTFLNKK